MASGLYGGYNAGQEARRALKFAGESALRRGAALQMLESPGQALKAAERADQKLKALSRFDAEVQDMRADNALGALREGARAANDARALDLDALKLGQDAALTLRGQDLDAGRRYAGADAARLATSGRKDEGGFNRGALTALIGKGYPPGHALQFASGQVADLPPLPPKAGKQARPDPDADLKRRKLYMDVYAPPKEEAFTAIADDVLDPRYKAAGKKDGKGNPVGDYAAAKGAYQDELKKYNEAMEKYLRGAASGTTSTVPAVGNGLGFGLQLPQGGIGLNPLALTPQARALTESRRALDAVTGPAEVRTPPPDPNLARLLPAERVARASALQPGQMGFVGPTGEQIASQVKEMKDYLASYPGSSARPAEMTYDPAQDRVLQMGYALAPKLSQDRPEGASAVPLQPFYDGMPTVRSGGGLFGGNTAVQDTQARLDWGKPPAFAAPPPAPPLLPEVPYETAQPAPVVNNRPVPQPSGDGGLQAKLMAGLDARVPATASPAAQFAPVYNEGQLQAGRALRGLSPEGTGRIPAPQAPRQPAVGGLRMDLPAQPVKAAPPQVRVPRVADVPPITQPEAQEMALIQLLKQEGIPEAEAVAGLADPRRRPLILQRLGRRDYTAPNAAPQLNPEQRTANEREVAAALRLDNYPQYASFPL